MSTPSALTLWLAAITSAFDKNELIKIVLKTPKSAISNESNPDLKSVDVRPIVIKREMKLSFTYHHKTRDIVKNYGIIEAQTFFSQLLSETFNTGRAHTKAADFTLVQDKNGFKLTTGQATMQPSQTGEAAHNRAKNHLISSSGKSYLTALNLTDQRGNILNGARDKFRQINKYIEIIDGLIKDMPPQKLHIVDMGAGKGYLTFALYDHIANNLKRDCEIIGVEMRNDLVKLCNDIAKQCSFAGLTFIEGSISSYDCSGADIVIALHACDTATDDAIAKAIKANAKIIVVAPCCHKQIRREMKAVDKEKSPHENPHTNLDFLLRFGTYEERLAEMITDSLRAQLMELSGYECNLFEFISPDHTPKNVMIVAKKMASARKAAAQAKIAAEILNAKQTFGISVHRLEELLGN